MGLFFDFIQSNVRSETAKGMDGLAQNVDGRYPGRGQDRQAFVGHFSKIAKEGRFARTGLPGDKDMMVGVLQQVKGLLKLLVNLYGCGYGHEWPLQDQEGEMFTPI